MFDNLQLLAGLEAIIMMLVAAILGGLIVWLLMRTRSGSDTETERRYRNLETQYADVQARALSLQADLKACTEQRKALEAEMTGYAALKTQYTDLQNRQQLVSPLPDAQAKADLAALQARYSELEAKYLAAQAQLDEAENELDEAEAEAEAARAEAKRAKESEAEILARIQARASEINFDRIGIATIDDKDDLKIVKGIGPFIEKKLNSIGIFTFRQIANFTPEDEEKVNEVIEFFPGRIRRDNWVSQSLDLARAKAEQQAEQKKE
ncbi:MAG: hypothetical protein OHK0039_36710 [Bacteroidia bacterium]